MNIYSNSICSNHDGGEMQSVRKFNEVYKMEIFRFRYAITTTYSVVYWLLKHLQRINVITINVLACVRACRLQRKWTQKLLSISWNGVRLNLKFYQKYRISQRNQGNLVLRSIKHRLQNPIKFGIDDPGQNTSNGNGIGRCDVFLEFIRLPFFVQKKAKFFQLILFDEEQ